MQSTFTQASKVHAFAPVIPSSCVKPSRKHEFGARRSMADANSFSPRMGDERPAIGTGWSGRQG
eukprot:2196134-Prymnesium_polylepis.1